MEGNLKLVGFKFSWAVQKVVAISNLANAPLTSENVNWGDSSRDALKLKTQTSTLPYLETSQGIISESLAISYFIAETYKPELLGANSWEKALVGQWVQFAANEIARFNKTLIYPIFGFSTAEKTEVDTANKELKEFLKVLDKHLQGKSFAVGNSITLADVELFNAVRAYFTLAIVEEQRKNLYPNILKWFNSLSTNSALVKAFGRIVLCKVPQKAPKVEKAKEEPKKKEEAKPKAEKKETGEGDEEEGSKKKKNALDSLPPSNFNFDEFKKSFLNSDKVAALNDFWSKIDTQGYSFWFTQYQRLPSEGKVLFKTSNFSSIFLQKLDPFRKYCFAAFGVYGVEGDYEIRGVWVWRGTEIPEQIKEHDSYEYTTFKKLDPTNNAADKQLVTDYWLNT